MGRSLHGSDAYGVTQGLYDEELPEHLVAVDSFALDTFEVTLGRFRAFVLTYEGPPAEGTGAHPAIVGSGWQSAWNEFLPASREEYLARLAEQFAGYSTNWEATAGANEARPILVSSWYEAFAFCAWDGGRLPTEAEWEYAAAGGERTGSIPGGQRRRTRRGTHGPGGRAPTS